jgi:hypothetical protein
MDGVPHLAAVPLDRCVPQLRHLFATTILLLYMQTLNDVAPLGRRDPDQC